MTSLQWLSRTLWNLPVALVGFVLTSGTSVGCQSGQVVGPDDAAIADGGSVCTPESCAGLAAPALAKLCPDGTTLTADVCEDQGGGRCGWGFPACPTDACAGATALPCVPCPYGSVGIGKDENGSARPRLTRARAATHARRPRSATSRTAPTGSFRRRTRMAALPALSARPRRMRAAASAVHRLP
jgi:hypothetical protein